MKNTERQFLHMNKILPKEINQKKAIPIFLIFIALFCLTATLINIFCLSPIYFNLENNTIYQGSPISLTIKHISDLFDILAFTSVYALIIFSMVLLNKKTTAFSIVVYLIILVAKIPLKLVMNIPLYGTIGTKNEIIADILFLSFYLIAELLQLIFVSIFASVTAKSYLRAVALSDNKKASRSKNYKIENILPIKKFINWYNPLLRSAAYMGIIVALFRIFSRIITDIEIGAPSSFGEVLVMIVSYLTDIIYGIVSYIIAIFIFNLLYDFFIRFFSQKNNKAEENNSSALFENDNLSE